MLVIPLVTGSDHYFRFLKIGGSYMFSRNKKKTKTKNVLPLTLNDKFQILPGILHSLFVISGFPSVIKGNIFAFLPHIILQTIMFLLWFYIHPGLIYRVSQKQKQKQIQKQKQKQKQKRTTTTNKQKKNKNKNKQTNKKQSLDGGYILIT